MTEHIRLKMSDDSVAIATMINGENRFRTSFVNEWNTVLDKLESDASVKAVIIQGEGKSFSYGLDIDFLSTQTPEYIEHFRSATADLYRRICLFPVPTVAIINGHAFGAGAFLALSCDYRVMRSDRGWLCWPETALGMKLRPASLQIIRAKMSNGCQQRDAIIFSRRLTAKEAKGLQLVDVITSEEKLYDSAVSLVRDALGPRGLDRKSLATMKRDIYGKEMSLSKI